MEADKFSEVATVVADQGWCVYPNFLTPAAVEALINESRAQWDDGAFRHAGVGRGENRKIMTEVRRDYVLWLDPSTATHAQQAYLSELEHLRRAVNQALFLGLFEFEGHFAVYPEGAFYKRHLDQFKGAMDRVLTCILYLNRDWSDADGGHLRFYLDQGEDSPYVDVTPHAGTLVAFLSDTYYHEVLPARRERMSITGWFRVRS